MCEACLIGRREVKGRYVDEEGSHAGREFEVRGSGVSGGGIFIDFLSDQGGRDLGWSR